MNKVLYRKIQIFILFIVSLYSCDNLKIDKEHDDINYNEDIISQSVEVLLQVVNVDTLYFTFTKNPYLNQLNMILKVPEEFNAVCNQKVGNDQIIWSKLSNSDFNNVPFTIISFSDYNGMYLSDIAYFDCGEKKVANFIISWNHIEFGLLGINFYFVKNNNSDFYKLKAFKKL